MEWADLIRIPVVPGGRSREAVDCWGLLVVIYFEMLGISLPHYDTVDWTQGEEPVLDTIVEETEAHWAPVAAGEHRQYDAVVLRMKGVPWHVGVVVDQHRFIHADPLRGVCLERFAAMHWKSRIEGFRRYKGIDDALAARTS